MEIKIEVRESVREDYIRLATNFDVYNAESQAPKHEQLKYLFQAKLGDKLVGESVVEKLFGVVEPKIFLVEEGFRGKGIGTQLIKAIENFALESKSSSIIVWSNTWSGVGFYERCGFKEIARVPLKTEGRFNGEQQFNVLYIKEI